MFNNSDKHKSKSSSSSSFREHKNTLPFLLSWSVLDQVLDGWKRISGTSGKRRGEIKRTSVWHGWWCQTGINDGLAVMKSTKNRTLCP